MIKTALAAVLIAPFAAISQDNAPAATPAADAGAATTGTGVFFRGKKMMGAMISYKVRENGIELCKLSNGTFCTVQAPVGKHLYATDSDGKNVLNLEVESGETYYLQASISMGMMAGNANLAPSKKEDFEGMKGKLKDNSGKDLDPPEAKDKK